jgi:RNA polymerase sigma-70 factor, ECF subfamily
MTGTRSSNPAADTAMDRYAGGDNGAFCELYDSLAPRLYAFIVRKVQDHARAEDLVQQTMMHVHCARGSFVRGSKVTPWAFAIIRRLLVDQMRRKKLELLDHDGEPGHDYPSQHPGPDESVHSKQLEEFLRRQLLRLSPAQRSAFELVYYAQMTHAEAAEVLGVTVASVKLRVQRANQCIRAALGEPGSYEGQ